MNGSEVGTDGSILRDRPRAIRETINGVLLLDKPIGITSNTALQRAKRLLGARKAGHTGTLDPLASGLLPLCLGNAARFANDLLNADKSYQATMLLGVTTTSGDADGEVSQIKSSDAVTEQDIRGALEKFRGIIHQIPPMHSAIKIGGQALYKLARQGIEVERASRQIEILELTLLASELPHVELHVKCSKGTYIRTLAEDIGHALGCGAHLVQLRRTGVGNLTISDAVSFDRLEELDLDRRRSLLRPSDSLVQALPQVRLDAEEASRFCMGQPIDGLEGGEGLCRVYADDGSFLGIGLFDSSGCVHPKKVVAAEFAPDRHAAKSDST